MKALFQELSRWRLLAHVSLRRGFRLRVGVREPLAHVLVSKSEYVSTKGLVKPKTLMPAKDGNRSVFRIGGLRKASVLALAQKEVGDKRGKTVLGWGELLASAITKVGLAINPDDNPPRHANITGWPDEMDERLEKAQDLAHACRLHLVEHPPVRSPQKSHPRDTA